MVEVNVIRFYNKLTPHLCTFIFISKNTEKSKEIPCSKLIIIKSECLPEQTVTVHLKKWVNFYKFTHWSKN